MSRVLHIEDDPRNRLLVRKLLAAEGHEVIDAADGLEGVRSALTLRPDLVLVDLNIPGLDGYEVTLRLRGEPSLSGVPIVAITAEGDRDRRAPAPAEPPHRGPPRAEDLGAELDQRAPARGGAAAHGVLPQHQP